MKTRELDRFYGFGGGSRETKNSGHTPPGKHLPGSSCRGVSESKVLLVRKTLVGELLGVNAPRPWILEAASENKNTSAFMAGSRRFDGMRRKVNPDSPY